MTNQHVYHTIWAIIIIVIAIIVAILASVWPQERLSDIIYVTRFFDVTLPILAFGALVKYLASCGRHGCWRKESEVLKK
jgi:uncharacterized membrane protein YedE/YeeE